MTAVSGIPPELLCKPKAVIGLIGLDVQSSPIHKSIWEAFSMNRRSDRVPLQFHTFSPEHEFPKSKPKRTSYDWYVPKGLLKTSWFRKHLEDLPAVAAVFFDLDWDEPAWRDRLIECSTRVEMVRKNLVNRGTKVVVVLVQKRAPLPPGEDMTAAERAQALCHACDLPAKNLYVLPQTDILFGYILRLESVFNELAMNYYQNQIKKVKSHKEFLNKTTHQLLFVRHQIKIAFFNELKQDTALPIKHYHQAYANLLELRMHDTHLLEVKTVAGFINYKICRLSFINNASEAISQFRKHIDFFKTLIGIRELAFEHEAWMSNQFELLGNLFHTAIRTGLKALMTQHPGLYYLEAAKHAISRRRLTATLCSPALQTTQVLSAFSPNDILVNHHSNSNGASDLSDTCDGDGRAAISLDRAGSWSGCPLLDDTLEFYGQRPWRQGNQSIDPPDSQREKTAIEALQCRETEVPHSKIIIPLLNHAIAQYEKYDAKRMRQYPLVMMGEEYFHSSDYKNALACFHRVTHDFRKERWWHILTSIWTTALKCAYLTGKVTHYISTALEIISENSVYSPAEKIRVHNNLLTVLQNKAPSPEPGCDSESCLEEARTLWQEALSSTPNSTSDPSDTTICLANIASCLEFKLFLSQESFTVDQPIQLTVYLKLSAPFPFTITKLVLYFSNTMYNKYGIWYQPDSKSTEITLQPGKIEVFPFSFPPEKEDVGKQIKLEAVCAELGVPSSMSHTVLSWSCSLEDYQQQVYLLTVPPLPARRDMPLQWNTITNRPVADIIPREAKLDLHVSHSPPLLVNEFYIIDLSLVSKETLGNMTAITLSIGLSDGQDFTLEQTTHISVGTPEFDDKFVARRIGTELGELQPEQKTSQRIFIKCSEPGDRKFVFEVSYWIRVSVSGSPTDCYCCKRESVLLPSMAPFESSVKVFSERFLPISTLTGGEPFNLQISSYNLSPWEIEVVKSELDLAPPVESVDSTIESQIENVVVKSLESIGECQALIIPDVSTRFEANMGVYSLYWRRKVSNDADLCPVVCTQLQLSPQTVDSVPIGVGVSLPSYGVLRTPFTLTYTLSNRAHYPHELEAQMDLTEGFMYSGNRTLLIRILPHSSFRLAYNLYPLITGYVELPKLHLKLVRYGNTEDSLARDIPTHIFIKPCGKEHISSVV